MLELLNPAKRLQKVNAFTHPRVAPPSTRKWAPVMKEAALEARNTIAAAISSGWPTRPCSMLNTQEIFQSLCLWIVWTGQGSQGCLGMPPRRRPSSTSVRASLAGRCLFYISTRLHPFVHPESPGSGALGIDDSPLDGVGPCSPAQPL